MARGLITDYGILMKAMSKDFQTNNYFPIRDTRLIGLIRERYGESVANKNSVVPCYEYRLNIPSTLINFLYLIDIQTNNDNPEVFIRDGIYMYDDYIITIINVDLSIFSKDVDYKDVATFFDNFRSAISNFFIDTLLRPTDSIFLTYFGAFCAIHSNFDINKEVMIEMQQYMKQANQCVEEENKIYENMLALYKASHINYLNVCRAYEDGMNNVESNSVPVSKVVPSVQEGSN